jgi:dephospho-CoA kinase
MLIELAGSNGVGKSTIAPLLAEALRDLIGDARVAALPEKGTPRRHRRWSRFKRRLWLISQPALIATAFRSGQPSEWLKLFSTMGLARKILDSGIQVVLVDQGILRTVLHPDQLKTIPTKYLPDLVLHLTTDPATLTLRQLLRDKKNHQRHQGEERFRQGREIQTLLKNIPEALAAKAMQSYAKKFCDSPLTAREVGEIAKLPLLSPTEMATTQKRCKPYVLKLLRQQGTQITEIENLFNQTPQGCVQKCLDVVSCHLKNQKNDS